MGLLDSLLQEIMTKASLLILFLCFFLTIGFPTQEQDQWLGYRHGRGGLGEYLSKLEGLMAINKRHEMGAQGFGSDSFSDFGQFSTMRKRRLQPSY